MLKGLRKIKAKLRKLAGQITGKTAHLKVTISVPKKWYGNDYGGFFICPKFLNEKSVIYSFGIGEDISFDLSMIENHRCTVYGFDPTPKSIEWIKSRRSQLPAGFVFFEYGISNKTGIVDFFLPKNSEHVSGSFVLQDNVNKNTSVKVMMKSLTDIMAEMGHKKIDVLKMDIEGAEYQVLEGIVDFSVIDQMVIEFHDRFLGKQHSKTSEIIDKLKDHGFEIFAVSDSLEEVSFINKRIL